MISEKIDQSTHKEGDGDGGVLLDRPMGQDPDMSQASVQGMGGLHGFIAILFPQDMRKEI
jgi:hypothetical protein